MKTTLESLCKQMRLAHVLEVYETIPFETPTQYLQDLLNAEQRGLDQMRLRKLMNKAKFNTMLLKSAASGQSPYHALVRNRVMLKRLQIMVNRPDTYTFHLNKCFLEIWKIIICYKYLAVYISTSSKISLSCSFSCSLTELFL